MMFAYVWEYRVRPEAAAAFEAAYGGDGDWVRLFREHEGYERTELLRDASDPLRYVTVDFWRSRGDYDRFREVAAAAYEEIDRACAALTVEERHLGDFEVLAGAGVAATDLLTNS